MVELSPQQMQVMERLFAAGFRPVAIPPYEIALSVKKGNCAVLLAPVPSGGFKLLASPSYLVDGNLSVKLKRVSAEWFVWKQQKGEAIPEKLGELEPSGRKRTEL